MHRILISAAAAGLAVAAPAAAQDQTLYVYGGVALEYSIEPNGPGSDNVADFETYVEVEKNGFYAGIWGQASSDDTTNEVDVYIGYRRTLDSGFSYDVGYTRYFYPNDGGNCCGELTASFGIPAGDMLAFSTDLAWDPEDEVGSAYVGVEVYPMDKLTLSANAGVYQTVGLPDESEWDIGATWNFTDEVALDLRWYEGSDYDGYAALYLSFDTTLLGG